MFRALNAALKPEIKVMGSKTRSVTAKPSLSVVTDDQQQAENAADRLPIMAVSQFCDDVRMETTGKLFLIGCYPANIIALNPAHSTDRLWVVTKILWPRDFDATGMRICIDVPAQQPGFVAVETDASTNSSTMLSATSAWQVRFPPLRPGDVIRVHVECGGGRVNCGELTAAALPPLSRSTRH
jgi:hypothetical protein